jgi:general secretion pathway protein D
VRRKLLILLVVAWFVQAGVLQAGDEADSLYAQGQKAQRAGDLFHAYLLYAEAAKLEPGNFAIAAHKNQTGAVLASTMSIKDAKNAPDPDLAFLELMRTEGPAQFDEFGPTAPAPHLNFTNVKKKFDLTADAKTIIQKVGEAYGIQMIFANDWSGPRPFPFRTGELDMMQAFRLLEDMTTSLIEPIDGRTALVTRDTPQRRTEVVPVVTMAIPIPERFAVQDAQEMVQAVQQVLDIRRAQVDPARRMVFFRDAESKVLLARRLLNDLSRLRPQVEVDVQLLTMTKQHSANFGLTLPNTFSLVNLGNFLNNAISPGGFANFATFGGGKTLFGLGVTAAQAFATVSDSLTQSMLNAQVTAVDGQPASLNVGTRYPIATAQFIGATPSTTPTPTVTYQDLGLVLKLTPTVQGDNQIALDVDAAFTTLGTISADGIPSIAQRKFQGKVRLAPGQWAVLTGLTTTTESFSTSGIAGLSRLPLLGHLFRGDTIERDSDDTLIVMKPRIIGLAPWDFPVSEMEVGSETRPISLF